MLGLMTNFNSNTSHRRVTILLLLIQLTYIPQTVYSKVVKTNGTTIVVKTMASSQLSNLAQTAAQMQPGQWVEITTQNFENGRALEVNAGGGTYLEFSDEAQYDPINKRIYFIGCARRSAVSQDPFLYSCADTADTNSRFIYYSINENKWIDMPKAPISISYHSYDHAALNRNNGDFYFREGANNVVKKYSASSGQWSTINGPSQISYSSCCVGFEFFPDLNSLIYFETTGGQIFSFNESTKSWSTQNLNVPSSYEGFSEYSLLQKTIYFGGGKGAEYKLFSYDVNRSVRSLPDSPVSLGQNSVLQSTNPTNGNLLVFSKSGTVHEFNLATNQWISKGQHPLKTFYNDFFAAGTPIDDLNVLFIVNYVAGSGSKVYLYKP